MIGHCQRDYHNSGLFGTYCIWDHLSYVYWNIAGGISNDHCHAQGINLLLQSNILELLTACVIVWFSP